ncbi:hypothetical protein PR048_024778 [Dryococelus australis]|uniref:Uncharacterized protein n=1 Tax=Dryococelus australis TaxID=614101 RepID=A0ABQ9GPI3_9NEOP|nr:hypothetical protein PR048_024778 [Dryococelus australis]
MHTVVYIMSSGTIETKCFCTVSCSLQHNAPAILAYLFPPMNDIVLESIHTIHFLSDSPSGQYRNKSMFLFLANHLKIILQNYQEVGHGKGVPDGIGGVGKCTADRMVAQGSDLPDMDTLINVLQQNCLGVKIFSLSKTEIEKISEVIEKWKVLPVKGTVKVSKNLNRLRL